MIIPAFGFNTPVEKSFSRWPDAVAYVDTMPLGGSGSFERASHNGDVEWM